MQTRTHHAIAIITAAALAALPACKKSESTDDADADEADLPEEEPAEDEAPGEETDASFGIHEQGYLYDPVGKRDPFRSFILDRLKELDSASKGPLEQFDLSQLSVSGIVWDTARQRALILDPSGQGYIIEEGDAIGKNDGRVITIEDNVWIGAHTTIMDGVTVGRDAIIGAGSVVLKDVPPYGVAVGVPAKVVRDRRAASGGAVTTAAVSQDVDEGASRE